MDPAHFARDIRRQQRWQWTGALAAIASVLAFLAAIGLWASNFLRLGVGVTLTVLGGLLAAGAFGWLRAASRMYGPLAAQSARLDALNADLERALRQQSEVEQALKESDTRFSAFMNNSPIIAFIKDSAGRLIWVNRAHERAFAYRFEDRRGKTDTELWGPIHGARLRANDQAILDADTAREVEEVIEQSDGLHYWTSYKFPLRDAQGRQYLAGMAIDNTERRTREAITQAREARLRAILSALPDLVIVADAQGHIRDVMARDQAELFAPPDQLIGHSIHALFPAPLARQFQEIITRTVTSGQNQQLEYALPTPKGERWFESRCAPMTLQDEVANGVVWVARDVTERRRMEQERTALRHQLNHAQRMETLGKLTGGVAHDFNNMLGGILGYCRLAAHLVAQGSDHKLASHLAQIQRAGERARDLIRQMMVFSRGGEIQMQPVDLTDLLNEAVTLLRPTMPASIEFRVLSEPDLPRVEHDPVQVQQILANLCVNARDAMGQHGRIEFNLRKVRIDGALCASCGNRVQGVFVELAVADSGNGLPPDMESRIFEPFFTTKGVGKGSGMGLAIVHGLMHRQGGHIMVESTPGAGTCFRLQFPPVEGAGNLAAHGEPNARSGEGAQIRVLVIDDESTLTSFMSELLMMHGFLVSAHTDPVRAYDAFAAEPTSIDLVITDQTMPSMTGLELTDRVHAVRDDLPIVIVTGYSQEVEQAKERNLPKVVFMQKPINPDHLIHVIETLTKQSGQHVSKT